MPKPSVIIDGIVFENYSQIGIWRIFYEVMKRTSNDIDYTLMLAESPKQAIPSGIRVASCPSRYPPESRRRFYRQIADWPWLTRFQRKMPQAIWHSTFFSSDPRPGGISVVSIYDMAAEICYSIGPYISQRQAKRRVIAKADRAIAISETTAQECIRFFPQMRERINVIPLGYEHLPLVPSKGQLHANAPVGPVAESPYCLFVGGRYAYKNFSTMVKAVISEHWPKSLLLKVVGPEFDDAEIAWIAACGAERKIHHVGKITDSEMVALYQSSTCFVFPSLMEGFGIPVLEAQACGTVAALSDIPVFREVAGSAALFFSPHCGDSIAKSVTNSTRTEIRQQILHESQYNLQRYGWDLAAERTVECYEKLARSRL